MKRTMQCAAIAMAVCGVCAPAAYADTTLQTYQTTPSGSVIVIERSPRSVYLDEMGRPYVELTAPATVIATPAPVEIVQDRWDAGNRGRSPAEVSRITGKVDSTTSGMPIDGSGVQAGNMGPANSKGQ